MKTLDTQIAKQIALDLLSQVKADDMKDFLMVHSEKVGNIATIIGKKLGIESDIFVIAGWCHDIGYSENFENHANESIKILKNMGYDISTVLADCISNHGRNKQPKNPEGKIFQLADKFSIFDSDTIEVMLKHDNFPFNEETTNFLKMFTDGSFDLMEKF